MKNINFSGFKVVQLHDKNTEEILGSVICRNIDYLDVCNAWDSYEGEDIRDFEESHSEDGTLFQVIDIDFYQP